MLSRIWILVMLVSTPAFAADPAPSASASAAPAARDRFAGTYTFSGGDKERKGIDLAIGRAISSLFFMAKPFAIRQLHAKTAVKNSVGFSFANGKVVSTASDAAPAASPDDGTPVPYVVDGESLRLSQTVDASGHLIQIFSSSQGSRTNDYTLSADGKTLTMTVTVASPRLPQSVHYALTYTRNP